MAKRARAVTPDRRAEEHARRYLDVEARVNAKLRPLPTEGADAAANHGARHVAPYVGERDMDGARWLLWEASGERTLEDYIEMPRGQDRLAMDLGLAAAEDADTAGEDRRRLHDDLAAEVLRQLLEGLAYCHSRGVVHRDVKVRCDVARARAVGQADTRTPGFAREGARATDDVRGVVCGVRTEGVPQRGWHCRDVGRTIVRH